MPVTVETIALTDLALVLGAPPDPLWRAHPTPASLAQAQDLLARIEWLETHEPGLHDTWTQHPGNTRLMVDRVLDNRYTPHAYWQLSLTEHRWLAEWGPLATSAWVLKIEGGVPLPRLRVQRIDDRMAYYGHWTNRTLLSAARLKELPSLSCEIYEE